MRHIWIYVIVLIITSGWLLCACNNYWGESPEQLNTDTISNDLISSNNKNDSPKEVIEQTAYYSITRFGGLYYYNIINSSHIVVKTGGPMNRPPKISVIENRLIKCTSQAGTGIATQSGYYYDLRNNTFSDIFPSIWDEYDELVVYTQKGSVIIQNIFLKEKYYVVIDEFEKPFSPTVEPFVDVRFWEDGSAITVRYLTGENYEQVTETILLNKT